MSNIRLFLMIGAAFSFFYSEIAFAAPDQPENKKKTNISHHKYGNNLSLVGNDSNSIRSNAVENISVTTGTHSGNRKARDSLSPVTVISSATLRRSGQMNLADALTHTYASITQTPMGNDTAALTSSIRMRGLSPNEVLVLVDGKRRHTTGNFNADGGPDFASTPVDLNMIPANAIDHIEVLEDGAAAMYGSDAVAGVVNIITKKQDHGLNLSGQTGANAYNGDGWQYQLNADGGMKLGEDGFLHISGQMYHSDHMVPKVDLDHRLQTQPADHGAASYTGSQPLSVHSNRYESTPEETRENLAIEWGKKFTPGIEFYGLITYAHRHAEAYQQFRLPTVGSSISSQVDAAVQSLAPQGFSPLEVDEENDFSATLGLRGNNFLGFNWDISSVYGEDIDRIGLNNSYNIRMLSTDPSICSTNALSDVYSADGCGHSPSKTRAETFTSVQWTNNVDFRRHFNIGHKVPMTLAFGAEERMESYAIRAGNPSSYQLGGFQSYSGISPQSAGTWYRDIWAWYLDGDFHLTKKWDLDFAGRLEHYTDIGNTENGKISTRYNFNRRIAVRATISTGFRAPTLAESHYSALNSSPTGASGILPNASSAAAAIGASRLKPERSTTVSGGFVLEPVNGFHVEADVYQINLRDRIVEDSNYGGCHNGDCSEGENAAAAFKSIGVALPAGFTGYNDVFASYLANGGSTRTQGLDIKADYAFHFHKYGNLALTMALDLNRTRLHHNGTDALGEKYLNLHDITSITTDYPRSKIILNAFYTVGNWDFNIRQTRYGQTTDMMTYQDWAPSSVRYSTTQFDQFIQSPRWLTDIEIGYRFNSKWHLAVGANNVFNVRPRLVPAEAAYLGAMPYDNRASQIPFTGGYYYGRLNANF